MWKSLAVSIVNLEEGRPSGEEALRHLRLALRLGKRGALKLIHGYGSGGTGGVIRRCVRRELSLLKQQGRVREVVPGEDFSPFDAGARHALDLCPELSRDGDFNRANPGITMVIL